jgi:DNA-binding protein H-NS
VASGRKARKDAGTTAAAKFRGPSGEEWSGRGRLPKWLRALEAEGKTRDQFRI